MADNKSEVILVDEKDNQIGKMEKLEAHRNGARLHRAFSVFVFNKKGETLLQRRTMTKYHSKGKWTNTCCSHPYVGESVSSAAHRRLGEEMGFDCDMKETFNFTYKAPVGNELAEWEFDHVFFGNYDGEPKLNPEEADAYKWVSLDKLKRDIAKNPEAYTPWIRIIIDRVIAEKKKA